VCAYRALPHLPSIEEITKEASSLPMTIAAMVFLALLLLLVIPVVLPI
jgi:hypothetical protein